MTSCRYVLRNTPENWTDQLRKRVLEAFDCVLEMLALIQVHLTLWVRLVGGAREIVGGARWQWTCTGLFCCGISLYLSLEDPFYTVSRF